MPGAYAHITMAFRSVNPVVLPDMGLDDGTVGSLMRHLEYFLLGAVSPDMPYLVGLGNTKQAIEWANRMHRLNVAERIGAGVQAVAKMEGNIQDKCLAWLLGFVEHVVFDVFMHPVVNEISGGQYSNSTKDRHQWCEMNQDVHILMREFGITDVSNAEIVKTVIANIHAAFDEEAVDPDVRSVFQHMLQCADADIYAGNEPDIDGWYASFVTKMKIQEGSVILSGIGRHVGCHLVYPAASQRDRSYLEDLPVPMGTNISHLNSYDALFEHGLTLVAAYWKKVTGAVIGQHPYDPEWFSGWDLDTGEYKPKNSRFWSYP